MTENLEDGNSSSESHHHHHHHQQHEETDNNNNDNNNLREHIQTTTTAKTTAEYVVKLKGDSGEPVESSATPETAAIALDLESNNRRKSGGVVDDDINMRSVDFSQKIQVRSFDTSGRSEDTHGSFIYTGTPRQHEMNHSEVASAMDTAMYRRRKRILVVLAAALVAFNNGFLNGACLSGLASPGSSINAVTVTGLTASYSLNGLALSGGVWDQYGVHTGIILSYFAGTFIAGFITPNAKPYRLEPTYGPTFLIGGLFLTIAGIIAIFEEHGYLAFFFSAAASGLQNGIASKYSANLIRCTVTGTTTDVALCCAEVLRGNRKNLENGKILAVITFNFWLGGVASFFSANKFLKYTLLANAVMFWLIGLGLILFLVSELGLSLNAAVSGNWKWRKTINSLRIASKRDFDLMELFDNIDTDNDGEISPSELLEALLNAGVKTDLRTVKVLVNYADLDNNGLIDRDEWAAIVARVIDRDSNDKGIDEKNPTNSSQFSASPDSSNRFSIIEKLVVEKKK